MKTRLIAIAALLSLSLSGCVIDAAALSSALNQPEPSYGYSSYGAPAYRGPSYGYQRPPSLSFPPAPPPRNVYFNDRPHHGHHGRGHR
ncbi:hypothetical protein [Magnetospirillum moscoviense]|uniref:Lipoprotein n=1 Tax=Magnetospirillum moscoviense TaxID=1437059 RepID=A0A178MS22_9PROT|nr:hypothetical protein [Magnetospirillum moscoviense]OAN51520.1 hypothetical protein A6A05_01270 [Magnetospirillum moscoviense]